MVNWEGSERKRSRCNWRY